jgi:hypothetical protein
MVFWALLKYQFRFTRACAAIRANLEAIQEETYLSKETSDKLLQAAIEVLGPPERESETATA